MPDSVSERDLSERSVSERVIAVIARTRRIPPESVGLDQTFQALDIDSLDGMNIVFAVEEEFNINIPDEAAASLRSVRDVVNGIETLLAQQPAASSANSTANKAG